MRDAEDWILVTDVELSHASDWRDSMNKWREEHLKEVKEWRETDNRRHEKTEGVIANIKFLIALLMGVAAILSAVSKFITK